MSYKLGFFIPLRGLICTISTWRLIVFIYIIGEGIFRFNKYTYWNYTIQMVFDILLLISLILPNIIMKILSLIIFPIVLGSSFLVSIIIVIIIQRNDWEYVESTIFGLGNYHIGDIHSADWIIHSAPLIERLILCLFGQLLLCKILLWDIVNRFKCDRSQWFYISIYYAWWVLSPLIPLCIFSVFFNPLNEYPTGFNIFQAITIVLILDIIVQTLTFLYLITDETIKINFISDQTIISERSIITNCGNEKYHIKHKKTHINTNNYYQAIKKMKKNKHIVI